MNAKPLLLFALLAIGLTAHAGLAVGKNVPTLSADGEQKPLRPRLNGVVAQSKRDFYDALPADGKKFVDDSLTELKAAMDAAKNDDRTFCREISKVLILNARDEALARTDKTDTSYSKANMRFAVGLHLINDANDPVFSKRAAQAFWMYEQFNPYAPEGETYDERITAEVYRFGLRTRQSTVLDNGWFEDHLDRVTNSLASGTSSDMAENVKELLYNANKTSPAEWSGYLKKHDGLQS